MFVKNNYGFEKGDRVVLTEDISSLEGTMKAGSIVTITGIGERGYDIQDNEGNRVTECGWSGFQRCESHRKNIERI